MKPLALPDAILHPTPRMLRQFGAGLVVALTVLAYSLRASRGQASTALALALLIGALSMAAPRSLRLPFVAISAVTFPLGFVLQRALLALFFFLVFTPFALVLRGVRRAKGDGPVTGWRDSPPRPSTEDYFRPY